MRAIEFAKEEGPEAEEVERTASTMGGCTSSLGLCSCLSFALLSLRRKEAAVLAFALASSIPTGTGRMQGRGMRRHESGRSGVTLIINALSKIQPVEFTLVHVRKKKDFFFSLKGAKDGGWSPQMDYPGDPSCAYPRCYRGCTIKKRFLDSTVFCGV